MPDSDTILVSTAGNIGGRQLRANVGVCKCGDITDGVGLDLGDGMVVIAYASLVELAERATGIRATKADTAKGGA